MRYQWSYVHRKRSNFTWKSKWSSKNEFSMLEAESFFPNNLNHANSNGKQKNCVRHQIWKLLTIRCIWKMSFYARPLSTYIRKKVGIPEIVSDDRLIQFRPSNLISGFPTTPSNDFLVKHGQAFSPQHLAGLLSTCLVFDKNWLVFSKNWL